jgi:mannose/fructose/N-acetylgalactosamine-specific phosphotransferase system component IID
MKDILVSFTFAVAMISICFMWYRIGYNAGVKYIMDKMTGANK